MPTAKITDVHHDLTGVAPYVEKVTVSPFGMGRVIATVHVRTAVLGGNGASRDGRYDLPDGAFRITSSIPAVREMLTDALALLDAQESNIRAAAQVPTAGRTHGQ